MKVEIYKDDNGKYRWRRRAFNGEITMQGQAHKRKWNAKRAARKYFPNDTIHDLTKQ